VVFCALHDQLASLGRHAQLTRCFFAVAELLVHIGLGKITGSPTTMHKSQTSGAKNSKYKCNKKAELSQS